MSNSYDERSLSQMRSFEGANGCPTPLAVAFRKGPPARCKPGEHLSRLLPSRMYTERQRLRLWSIGSIAILSFGGVFLSSYLALVHVGVIGTLACGTSGGCAVVQASKYAVQFGIPVPIWGMIGYGAIMATSIAILHTGSRRLRNLLYALAVSAVLTSAYLSALEAFVIHVWCRWCIVSAFLTVAIGGLAVVDAWMEIRERSVSRATS